MPMPVELRQAFVKISSGTAGAVSDGETSGDPSDDKLGVYQLAAGSTEVVVVAGTVKASLVGSVSEAQAQSLLDALSAAQGLAEMGQAFAAAVQSLDLTAYVRLPDVDIDSDGEPELGVRAFLRAPEVFPSVGDLVFSPLSQVPKDSIPPGVGAGEIEPGHDEYQLALPLNIAIDSLGWSRDIDGASIQARWAPGSELYGALFSWIRFDPQTGTIFGTPPSAAIGYTRIQFQAVFPDSSIEELSYGLVVTDEFGGVDLLGYADPGAQWGLTTMPMDSEVDTTPPVISKAAPLAGSEGWSVDTPLYFRFSERMVRGDGSIVIRDERGDVFESFDTAVSRNISLIHETTLRVTPTRPFEHGTHYTVSFSPEAFADLAGNTLSGELEYGFTTIASGQSPQILVDVSDSANREGLFFVAHSVAGASSVVGGEGWDQYWVDDVQDRVLDEGVDPKDEDWVTISSGEYGDHSVDMTWFSGVENLQIRYMGGSSSAQHGYTVLGNELANRISGTVFADELIGNAGNDVFEGGGGGDSLAGGAGDDVYLHVSSGDKIIERPGEGFDVVMVFGVQNFVLDDDAEIEAVYLYQGATLSASSANRSLVFIDGIVDNRTERKDKVNGTGGSDAIYGFGGSESITAGDGDDFVSADAGDDLIIGGSGAGNDTYSGGDGLDTVRYTSATSAIRVNLAEGTASGAEIGSDQLTGIENLVGGQAGDSLQGSSGANIIDGYTGDDLIEGAAGSDSLYGGSGRDSLDGGQGNDIIIGGEGVDTAFFSGRAADYSISWSQDKTVLTVFSALDGSDSLSGVELISFSDHLMEVAVVDDSTHAGTGGDSQVGGGGSAPMQVVLSQDFIRIKAGLASAFATNETPSDLTDDVMGSYTLLGTEVVSVWGTAKQGVVVTTEQVQVLLNALKDATTLSELGAAYAAASQQLDLKVFAYIGSTNIAGDSSNELGVVVPLSAPASFPQSGDLVFSGVVEGGSGNDSVGGGSGNDTLNGGNGTDSITGGSGNSSVGGGGGDDSAPADVFSSQVGTEGRDNLTGGNGNDLLVGLGGGDTLKGREGADTLVGGAGDDVLYGAFLTGPVPLPGDGADSLVGGDGVDLLRGNAGNDTLLGGAGNDNLRGDGGSDWIDGGEGDDLVSYTYGPLNLSAGVSLNASGLVGSVSAVQFNDGIGGTDTVLNVEGFGFSGTNHGDSVIGSSGPDHLLGAGGNDLLDAGPGDDPFVQGGYGDDSIDGGSGNDTLYGESGRDSLYGNSGDDQLWGGDDNDTLMGGSGSDTLHGDKGQDLLDGGEGDDLLSSRYGIAMVSGPTDMESLVDVVAVQSGGYLGLSRFGAERLRLTRLTADGNLDKSVGSGRFDLALGFPASPESLLETTGGKFFVVGNQISAEGMPSSGFVARVGATGQIDRAFGVNGVLALKPLASANATLQVIEAVLDTDGSVWVLSSEFTSQGTGVPVGEFALHHIMANGSLDADFGTGGVLRMPILPSDLTLAVGDPVWQNPFGLALQSDEKLIVGVSAGFKGSGASALETTSIMLVRIEANGQLDTTFGTSGWVTVQQGQAPVYANDLIVVPEDGGSESIVVAGIQRGIQPVFAGMDPSDGFVQKIDSSGALDTSFGNQGSVTIDLWGATEYINAITYDPQTQGFVVVGAAQFAPASQGGKFQGFVERLNADGVIQNWGVSYSLTDGEVMDTYLVGALVTASGKTIAFGSAYGSQGDNGPWIGQAGLMSFDAHGQIDLTFGFNGDAQAERYIGGAGNDSLFGDAQADTLVGGLGNDNLWAGDGDDVFEAGGDDGAGDDTLEGGSNLSQGDTVSYAGASAAVSVNLLSGTASDGSGGTDQLRGIENVSGSSFGDSITGNDGSNRFRPGLGNDSVNGGNGSDWILYDSAQSSVAVNLRTGIAEGSEIGVDSLSAVERVVTGAGNDLLQASDAVGIQLYGRGGDDSLFGGNRGDYLVGGVGNDIMNGGPGFDSTGYWSDGWGLNSTRGVVVDLKTGEATDGWGGKDTLVSIEDVAGTPFDDVLKGGNPASGSLVTDGYEGFRGEAGNDTIDGGTGFDRARYDNSLSGIQGRFGGVGSGSVSDGFNGTDTLISIEEIRGSNFADSIMGTNEGPLESFEGLAGNDTFNGQGGWDRISFETSPSGVNVNLAQGSANDGWGSVDRFFNVEEVRGSDYADVLVGDDGANWLEGRSGNDQLIGGNGADTLIGGLGNDSLDGGQQTSLADTSNVSNQYDVVDYSSEGAAVTINLSPNGMAGVASGSTAGNDLLINIELVVGSAFNDKITGSDRGLSEIFRGGLGDDTIEGGSANDTGRGFDFVDYSRALGGVTVSLQSGTASGADGNDVISGIEGVLGSPHNDTIQGNDADNFLQPGKGDDSIDGGLGLDRLSLQNSSGPVTVDMVQGQVTGAEGNDTFINIEQIRGSAFADSIFGDEQANDFQARAGDDSAFGGAGDDTIHGGAGNDLVDGGVGRDTARFTGNRSEYAVTFNSTDGSIRVSDTVAGRDGVDLLSGIEVISFADGNYRVNDRGGIVPDVPGFVSLDPAASYLAGTGDVALPATKILLSDVGLAAGDVAALSQFGTFRATAQSPDTANATVALFVGADGQSLAPVAFNQVITPAQGQSGQRESTDVTADFVVSSGVTLVQVPEGAVALLISVVDNGFADNTDPDGDLGVFVRKYDTAARFSGSDNVFGSAGADSLFGHGSSDTLVGGAGNDLIDGGVLTDRIRRTDANTVSYNNSPAGVVVNLSGITGGGDMGSGTAQDGFGGTDTLKNVSAIIGSAYADSMTGSTARIREFFEGGAGDDTIDGGAIFRRYWSDTNNFAVYTNAPSAVVVDLPAGTAKGGDGNDTLLNINGVVGSGFDDTLIGGGVSRFFEGGPGSDSIVGGGFDTLIARSDSPVTVNLQTGTVLDGYGSTDTVSGIIYVSGSSFSDSIVGSDRGSLRNGLPYDVEQFQGQGGDDTIDGGKGVDLVDYSATASGVTVVLGSLTKAGWASDGMRGSDVLLNIEFVRGSAFADRLVSSDRNTYSADGYFEQFEGLEGNDTIDGSAGGPTRVSFQSSPTGVVVDLLMGQADDGFGGKDRLIGVDAVLGSTFDDRLTGDGGPNNLSGEAGNDSLAGGKGNDTLVGLLGNDTYFFNGATDGIDVIADSGPDNLSDAYGSADSLRVGGVPDDLTIEVSVNDISGTDVDLRFINEKNSIVGGVTVRHQLALDANGAVTGPGLGAVESVVVEDGDKSELVLSLSYLSGGSGADLVFGSKSSESLTGSGGNDVIFGGAGNDFAAGDSGDDTLFGSTGSDTLSGGQGDDKFDGGAGDDSIDGGEGTDTLFVQANAASFSVSRNADGSLMVVDNRDGSIDRANSIEFLSFLDVEVNLLPTFVAGNGAVQHAQNFITGTPLGDLIRADDLAVAADTSVRADQIEAGNGDDVIVAGAGNDYIQVGEGSDSVDGGAGEDQVVYTGRSSDHLVGNDSQGGVTVTSKLDGSVDVLTNVEGIYFQSDNKWVGLKVNFNPANPTPGQEEWAQNNINGTDVGDVVDADQLADAHNWTGSKVYKDWIGTGLGNDRIDAGKGGDWIDAGGGNDTINGGVLATLEEITSTQNPWGLYNFARYSGPAARYDISPSIDADGSITGIAGQTYFTVKDKRSGSPDGTDIVFNVDALQFSDKQVRLTPDIWLQREWGMNEQGQWVQKDKITGINVSGTLASETLGAAPSQSEEVKELFEGSDNLGGREGNDSLFGGAGADTLRGDKGNDTLVGGANRPAEQTQTWDPNGREGGDVAEYSGATSRYSITRSTDNTGSVTGTQGKVYFTVADSKAEAGEGQDTLIDVEWVRFSDGEKNLTVLTNHWTNGNGGSIAGSSWRGSDFADQIDVAASAYASYQSHIDAGLGNDTILGGNGADNISPGEGDDSIDGGGNVPPADQPGLSEDSVRYEVARSRFTITRNNDTNVVTVSDKLSDEFGGLGTDILKNVERIDFADGASVRLLVRFNANLSWSNDIQGTDFSDLIDADALRAAAPVSSPAGAGSGNDSMASTSMERDYIRPEAGDDTVYGGNGGDQIVDSAGNDFYDGGANGSSSLNQWERNDTVQFSGPRTRYVVEMLSYGAALPAGVKAAIDTRYPAAEDRPQMIVKVSDRLPVASGGDGTNYLVNIEGIQFAYTGSNDSYLSLAINHMPAPDESGWNNHNGTLLSEVIDARVFEGDEAWKSNVDVLRGEGGNDSLFGGLGADQFEPGTGNDFIDGGGLGSNAIYGYGVDSVSFSAAITRYTIQFFARVGEGEKGTHDALGRAVVSGGQFIVSEYYDPDGFVVVQDRFSDAKGGDGRDVLYNIQQVKFAGKEYYLTPWGSPGNSDGTMFSDRIVGLADSSNNLHGGDGNDKITGGSKLDYLTGGSGNDTLDGGDQPPVVDNRQWEVDQAWYQGSRKEFDVTRLVDTDGSVTGTAGQQYFVVKHFIDPKLGGLGTDIVINIEKLQFSGYTEDLTVSVFDNGGTLSGTNFGDEIKGLSNTLFFRGWGGDDTLVGAQGAETGGQFWGHGGDDSIVGYTDGDNAVYSDGRNRYVITKGETPGSWTVQDKLAAQYGGEGTDTLEGIEVLQFGDWQLGHWIWNNEQPWAPEQASDDSVVGSQDNDQHASAVRGGRGNDTQRGLGGDDHIGASLGNDLLDGGDDSLGVAGNQNWWNAGDSVFYGSAPSFRFDIRANDDGSFTVVDLASLKVLNDESFGPDGHLTEEAIADSNLYADVGFGKDTLIGIERIGFIDRSIELVPMTQSWTYTISYPNGSEQIERQITRQNINGTYRNDIILGSEFGDQINGRSGDDTIDGMGQSEGEGNPWDLHDIVTYDGARNRYDIKGVLVEIAGTEANPTYTIVSAGQASTSAVMGLVVTDSVPDSMGGSGSDLLVNVERVQFAWSPGGSDSSISLVPQVWTGVDWSSPLKDANGDPLLDDKGNQRYGTYRNSEGTGFADALKGGDYSDWIHGKEGDDTLSGGKGGDNLEGGLGNDLLLGGANGEPDKNGFAPSDTARYNGPLSRFKIEPTEYNGAAAFIVKDLLGNDDPSSLGEDILVGVENISFSDAYINLVPNRWFWTDGNGGQNAGAQGTKLSEVIEGDRKTDGSPAESPIRDYLHGGEGDDVLIGGGDGDNLVGSSGDDVLDGGSNGTSGNAWQDSDSAQFTGKSDRYTFGVFTVVMVEQSLAVQLDGRTLATIESFDSQPELVVDINTTEREASLVQRAFAQDLLTNGQSGLMVMDSLDSDLGGDGFDLVFNIEQLNFVDGPLELGARAWKNDWNGDGKLDNIWINGSKNADAINPESVALLVAQTAANIAGVQLSAELRAGDDSYLGGNGSDWVRPGAGNDYVDGGENQGTDQWGNANRDEVNFNARFSRFTVIDVTLSRDSNGVWTVSSSRNPDMTLSEDGTLTDPTEKSSEALLGMQQGLLRLIAGAGETATSVTGWLVVDKLPAEFDGLGVDALTNVEFLSFSDKWVPLQQQVWYHREQIYNEQTKLYEPGTKIVGSQSEGTNEADVMGFNAAVSTQGATYNFSGNDGFQGNDGNDSIRGGGGGDWLRGGAGDDYIDGGDDGVDTNGNPQQDNAQYSGEFSNYLISRNADGSITVKDNRPDGDGVDTLVNVESLGFQDRWVQLTQNIQTWKDPNGRIQNVNANGSILGDRIDLSKTSYTGAHHSIWGQEGDDTLVGSDSPDWINGGTGSDQIDGGGNGVDFWGNPGSDTVQYEGQSSRYTIERIRANTVDSNNASFNGQTFVVNGVSYLVDGSKGAITVNGQVVDVTLIRVTDSLSEEDGGSGVDLLVNVENLAFMDRWVTLKAAQNFVDLDGDGKPDAVNVRGTDGDDTLAAGDVSARMEGGDGHDQMSGGGADDVLIGGRGNDTLAGGDGKDVAQYFGAISAYTITQAESGRYTVFSSNDGLDTLEGIESLQFDGAFVSLVQTTLNQDFNADGITDQVRVVGIDVVANTLNFAANQDANLSYNLVGGSQADTLVGGAGNDLFEGGAGNDSIVGGGGTDRVRYLGNASDYTITDQGSGTYLVSASNGVDGVDQLVGVEEIRFADSVKRLGEQAVTVTSVDLDTDGNKKDDTRMWTASDEADSITGALALMNVIDAGAGSDVLVGGDLGDTFKPGSGDDTIDGGANTGVGADFKAAVDKVLLSGKQADYALSSVQKASFSFSGAVDAGDKFAVTVSGATYEQDADGSSTISTIAAGLKGKIQAGAGSSVTVSFDEDTLVMTITSVNAYVSVSARVTNSSSGDQQTSVSGVSFERFVRVTHTASNEIDVLKGVEQLVFADKVFNLNPAETTSAVWGDSGLTQVRSVTGTALADIIRSTTDSGDEMRGGAGSDRFVIGDKSGSDRISDFSAGAGGDVLTIVLGDGDVDGLNGTGAKTAQDLISRATQQDKDVKIDLGNGHSITLVNVLLADLTPANFDFMPVY